MLLFYPVLRHYKDRPYIIANFRLSLLLIIIEENKIKNVETFQYYDTQVLTLRYLDPGLAPTLLILSSQLIQNAQS